VENKTEAAYRRSAASLEKRRALMAAWAAYCNLGRQGDGNATPLRRTR
jgi:hypothetical protein